MTLASLVTSATFIAGIIMIILIIGLFYVVYYATQAPETVQPLASSFATIIAAGLGSVSTFVLLTHNDRTKQNTFKTQVRTAIRYELTIFYDMLVEALSLAKPSPDNEKLLAIDHKSAFADKFWRLRERDSKKIYLSLDTETKLKTLNAEIILSLDRLYGEILTHGLHIFFRDNGTGDNKIVYLAIEQKEAEELREKRHTIIARLEK